MINPGEKGMLVYPGRSQEEMEGAGRLGGWEHRHKTGWVETWGAHAWLGK